MHQIRPLIVSTLLAIAPVSVTASTLEFQIEGTFVLQPEGLGNTSTVLTSGYEGDFAAGDAFSLAFTLPADTPGSDATPGTRYDGVGGGGVLDGQAFTIGADDRGWLTVADDYPLGGLTQDGVSISFSTNAVFGSLLMDAFNVQMRDIDGSMLSSEALAPDTFTDVFDEAEVRRVTFRFINPDAAQDPDAPLFLLLYGAPTSFQVTGGDIAVAPVPLPAGLPLLLAGVGLLGWLRARRA